MTDIQNIAPTILYLLDLPIARDMDGRVIDDALESSVLAAKKHYRVGDYNVIPWEQILSTKEREDLEKKLKSLGYIQ